METRFLSDQDQTIAVINDSELQDLLQLIGIKENEWLAAIAENAPLASRYKPCSHHTSAAAFAAFCSAAASFLYYEAGEKYGPFYVAGGISVNLTQNLLYSISTFFFIQESLHHFKQSWGRLTLATLIGSFATAPSTISTYEISGSLIKTLLNASGNFPNNIFGMYTAVNSLLDYKQDNPRAREFLQKKLRTCLQENELLLSGLEPERSNKTKNVGLILGWLLGLGVASAQGGYICASSKYIGKLVGNENAGIALGILSMMPTITIALLISGVHIGKSTVNSIVDIYDYLFGNKKIVFSPREKKIVVSLLVAVATSTWLATYSSATSKYLFNEKCNLTSTINDTLNSILMHMSDEGAVIYNSIMSSIAIKAGFDYFKEAYVEPGSSDQEKYKVKAMNDWIKQAPIQKVEDINRHHFANEESDWKKSPSCFTRLRNRFWNKDQTSYQKFDKDAETEKYESPLTPSSI